ncbi:OmpA family protein [Cronobacter malonaticus]|uniref:OmpA family protein n=1 Tax=Cronobacter malonaticus TaxID=413503 RepID=UPI000519037B|nr:OmpA family protein [Cronobacter malonaticus]EMD9271881.1 OmpA family protein [Cronobacter malonaticus]KIU61013.1 membrane protein [Cronobacter malonaticus ENBT0334]
MRKPIIISALPPLLISLTALLWLLWGFVPLATAIKWLITAGMLAVVCRTLWIMRQRNIPLPEAAAVIDLLADTHQGPIVLVCGDGMDELFPTQPVRHTAQGCWLRVGNASELETMVRMVQTHRSALTGQLAVMYRCLVDKHQDEAVLRAGLKTLRQEMRQVTTLTGFPLPVLLNCRFSGPETPWVIVRGEKPFVCPENAPQASLDEWLRTENNLQMLPVLNEAFAFIHEVVITELIKTDRLFPAMHLFAIAFHTGAETSDNHSLWLRWLYQRVCLEPLSVTSQAIPATLFADPLLSLLAPYTAPMQGGKKARRATVLVLCCALTALAFSVTNNHRLIQQIGGDLARWRAIPMSHYAPKARSLSVLKRDALLLERWQRQGEPLRYGLGLYSGQRLWLALQQAIDAYIPPPAPSTPAPHIVRLDTLSLFDTGQWRLKPGSTKVLVNALVGIKARPGWLIVVAGHTDDVGDERANQQLSLRRAESVRDWMRDTGDVPESCFAVQGYGESRPVAVNTTAQGRALNRRVEISLVPQADACRLPDIPLPPSQDESGTQP